MPPMFTVPQLCMLNIGRFIKSSPSSPSFMGLSVTVIPKISVLHSKFKSLRPGGQQVTAAWEGCVTEWRGEVLTLGGN